MTQIQQGRYDALLRRVGDLKGPGSKVNDVLEELFPMFDVENLPPELYILGLTDLCFGGGRSDGNATMAGRAQLFNPVGSGKILTLTTASFNSNTAGIVRWGRQDNPQANRLTTELFRDTRKQRGAVLSLPVGQIRVETSVALANATGQTFFTASRPVVIKDENGVMVLTEGTGFEMGLGSNNTSGSFYFYWRERVAEPSETNF